jgi:hypothetical protein
MAKQQYKEWKPRAESLAIVQHADRIIADYQSQRLMLTLRQLYYRFVAAGLIPNDQKNYTRLGGIIGDARMAGLLDWDAIEDRGRNLMGRSHWDSPADVINSAAYGYHTNLWRYQQKYVEVWVEKQALESVIGRVANEYDCSYMACKGYMSMSEMYATAQRFKRKYTKGMDCHIIHLGDHDPSGIDMTRDIRDRIRSDFGARVTVHRIALNMPQIEEYKPPPNPAKLDDPRAKNYIELHGHSSWELDALEPSVLHTMIGDAIKEHMDMQLFNDAKAEEEQQRKELILLSRNYDTAIRDLKARLGR